MTRALLSDLLSGFTPDCQRFSVPVAVLRAGRASRALALRKSCQALTTIPAFQGHLAAAPVHDPLFVLSHRHYLARGLTVRERVEAALAHYRHESEAFRPEYLEQVYARGGLVLWRDAVEGVTYDIRLMPGNDVLHEGGLSLVLHVDGGRVCVVSFSMVQTRLVLASEGAAQDPSCPDGTLPFVVRVHLAQDHSYQRAFHRAFARVTPTHLCFGALAGLALAQGCRRIFGIAPERQLAYSEQRRAQLLRTYADGWTSLGGSQVSSMGFLMDLPYRLTPLHEMDASQRKRAKVRRAYMEAVQLSALTTIRAYLTQDGSRARQDVASLETPHAAE